MESIYLNFARNALRNIIRTYEIAEINLPFYTCPSIWQAAQAENCRVKFYHIDENFMPEKKFLDTDYIVYTNYFGICAKNSRILAQRYKNLILDNAHAFYMEPLGLSSFNSIRKFFPKMKEGSILFLNNIENRDKKTNIQKIKAYSELNVEWARKTRMANFAKIAEVLDTINNLKFVLTSEDIPMIYPFLSQNAPKIRLELEKNDIELETYWSAMPVDSVEGYYQKYLLPIPIHQRLSQEEIEKTLGIILKTF